MAQADEIRPERPQQAKIPAYERAKLFRIYEPSLIPGLFQTAEYANAVMAKVIDFYDVPDDLDQAVAARLERQRLLYSGDRRFIVVLEEQALRTRMGGTQTLAGQLDRLLTLMSIQRVSLSIIPAAAERRTTATAGFWIFDDETAQVETVSAELTITQPREIALYAKKFEPGDYAAIAASAAHQHRPGTLTLVVLNTVDAARKVHAALPAGLVARATLLHSRFRGHERQGLVGRVTEPPGESGHIVVATQVVEARLDLDAAVLITEAAPWPCIVQRAGRCNRTGTIDGAQLCWISPAKHLPYPEPDVAASVAELEALQGESVTGEDLLGRPVAITDPRVAVLRRADLVGLFDTSPDRSGAGLDIAPYVRDADELDVQLIWATWEVRPPDGSPPAEAMAPSAEWRCRVPLGKLGLDALLDRKVAVWRLDQALGRWTQVTRQRRARPGEVLLAAAADGGYDPVSGFDPAARRPVPDCPVLGTALDLATGAEDAFAADSASVARRDWMTLQQHSEETRDQSRALLAMLTPDLPDGVAATVVTAAYLHDAGKVHKIWQDALCVLATPDRKAEIDAGGPWAKSDGYGQLRFAGDVAFRHELASLLLLDGPLKGLLADANENLARYLVLAHHGRLRVQVRGPDDAEESRLLGLEQDAVWSVPPLFGQPDAELTVDLDQFRLGGERSWTRTTLALRDRYRPFVIAYLETVVRIADWRASAGMDMAR